MTSNLARLASILTAASIVTRASADWPVEVVPHQAVHEGDYARMNVDPNGTVHLVMSTFFYAGTGTMNYHARAGSTWIDEPLWGDYGGIYLAAALDQNHELAFIHNRGWLDGGYYVRLASRSGGTWAHTPVANSGELPAPCALAFAPDGTSIAAFSEGNNRDLIFAQLANGVWTTELVDGDVLGPIFIGLSANGAPHLTYIDSNADITIATKSGFAWDHQLVHQSSSQSPVASISSVTDGLGYVHVAYALRNGQAPFVLHYAHQTPTTIVDEVVPASPTQGVLSLSLDAAGRPAIAFATGSLPATSNVSFARSNGTSWATQAVTSDGAWRLVDLGFLPDSTPVIALQRGSTNVVLISSPPGPPSCPADVDDGSGTGNPDGGVTIDDLLYYLATFEAGSISADVDDGSGTGTHDGGVTIDDLLYFLFRFEAGC